jgi:hypothetical protein
MWTAFKHASQFHFLKTLPDEDSVAMHARKEIVHLFEEEREDSTERDRAVYMVLVVLGRAHCLDVQVVDMYLTVRALS